MVRWSVTVSACLLTAAVCLASVPAGSHGLPVRGGTLVVAIASDPRHLNPAITTSGPTHAPAELLGVAAFGLVWLVERLVSS